MKYIKTEIKIYYRGLSADYGERKINKLKDGTIEIQLEKVKGKIMRKSKKNKILGGTAQI